ncbi:ubiquitin carboxyl-terminal hydrolase 45, partial [Caerostris extrusa]
KLRKAQNKKIVTELKEISPEADEVNSSKGAADNEEEIDVVNVDENEKLSESNDVDVETVDVDQDACNLNGFENLPNGDIISDSDEDSVKDKSPKEFKQVNHAIDNETGESISVCTKSSPVKPEDTSDSKKSLSSVKTVDDDYFVLFDDTICFDDETPVLSEDENQVSHTTINHTAEVVSECAIKIDVIGDDPVEASALGKTDTISEANPPGLEERMQALSMQVKEIRIRRDSDRQNSILSSSSSSTDDGESTKTTFESDESPEEKIRNQQEEDLSHNLTESQTKEWILKSLTTLQPRRSVAPLECSIDSCISNFTKPELLVGNNKYRCNNCTEMKRKKSGDKTAVAYSNASKQLLVFSPPAVLTLHLKRFQQIGMDLKKVNRFVEFPLILDLAPYCSSACLILPHMAQVKDEILYSLYGIVSHSGALSCGHYVAYVKVSKRTLNETFINKLPLAQCDLEQLLQKYHKLNTSMKSNGEKTESEGEKRWYYISDHAVKEVSEAVVLKCQAYLLFYERIK